MLRLQVVLAVLAAVATPGAQGRCVRKPSSTSTLPASASSMSSTAASSSAPAVSYPASSSVPSSSVASSSAASSIAPVSSAASSSVVPSIVSSSVVPSSTVSSAPAGPTNTFACDASGYLIQSSKLSHVNLGTGAVTPMNTNIGGVGTNAIGYNVLDNYLYGIQRRTDDGIGYYHVVRIDNQGISTSIGHIEFNSAICGDVDSEGFLWASSAGTNYLKIDVRPGSPTYGQLLAKEAVNNLGYTISDWSFLSEGGGKYLYTIATGGPSSGYTSTMLRFNKETKIWQVIRNYTGTPSNVWGSLYAFDSVNSIYAADNSSGKVFKFPLDGGDAVFVSQSSSNSPNDGASCLAATPNF